MMKIKTIIFSIIILMFFLFSSCYRKSGRKKIPAIMDTQLKNSNHTSSESSNKNIIKMEKENGVFKIPIEVNNVKMYFIFDTGASIISISETEAMFLWKQGSLSENDILGTANFSDANGDISEGTIINLKTVKIGNKTIYNIRASVVPNQNAPLLFGQSALGKFGKIFIDNARSEITFE